MRAALYATVALMALAACTPGQGSPGASPELASIFKFAAYPGARFVKETVYPGSIGPFAMPGGSGSQIYETAATLSEIRSHYEQLGQANGWTVSSTDPARLGYPAYEPFRGVIVSMFRERFSFSVSVSPTSDGLPDYGGPAYYPKVPVAPPDTRVSPPPVSPSPSASPTPTPTPYGGAYYLRIEGQTRQ